MTGPISFRPTPPTATPTTSTPIQRGAPVNAPPAPPPVRSPQAFQRSATASGSRPLDLQAEAASINTAITQANPEQIQANAARLNQLGLVPQGMPAITPEALQIARQNLKPVSQHQVLNLHDAHESDASRNTVVESGRSVKLKQGGSPFGVGIVLKPGATVEVLGHGSPDGKTIGGKTPQQLAKQLKAGGATQLAVLDLKSCHSEAFKAELQQCLASEGIQVGQIKTYQGSIAVSRATGEVVQGAGLEMMKGHDGTLALGDCTKVDALSTDKINFLSFENKHSLSGELHNYPAEVTKAIVEATHEAYGSLVDGSIFTKLASGTPRSSHLSCVDALRKGSMPPSFLNAVAGYLIEDRVTQILKENSFIGEPNYTVETQFTSGATRPDLVFSNPDKSGKVWLDLTASDSAGHILSKDAQWLSKPLSIAEVTYPSLPKEVLSQIILDQSKFSPDQLATALADVDKAKAVKKANFRALTDKFRDYRTRFIEQANQIRVDYKAAREQDATLEPTYETRQNVYKHGKDLMFSRMELLCGIHVAGFSKADLDHAANKLGAKLGDPPDFGTNASLKMEKAIRGTLALVVYDHVQKMGKAPTSDELTAYEELIKSTL